MRRRCLVLLLLVAALFQGAVARPSMSAPSQEANDPGEVRWLGLGDSFAAGEGLRFVSKNSDIDKRCQRARHDDVETSTAWAPQALVQLSQDRAAEGITEPIHIEFVACTGAITDNVMRQLTDQADQLYEASTLRGHRAPGDVKWDVVTSSFGGNNVGFADILFTCAGLNPFGDGGVDVLALLPWVGCDIDEPAILRRIEAAVDASFRSVDTAPACRESGNPASDIWDDDAGQGDVDARVRVGNVGHVTVAELYDILARCVVEPGGTVVVMGYPQLIETSGRWDGGLTEGNRCQRVRRADVNRIRYGVQQMNAHLSDMATEAARRYPGVEFVFVDPNTTWEKSDDRDRHALCGKGDDWLNGVTVGTAGDGAARFQRSFHPKQEGHDAEAALVADRLDHAALEATGASGGGSTSGLGGADVATSLVFDVSDSMTELAGTGSSERKIEAAIRVGRSVVNQLDIQAKANNAVVTAAGLVTFSSGSAELLAPTSDTAALRQAVDLLTTSGGTDLGAGLQDGLEQLQALGQGGTIVLLSDGVSNEGLGRDQILADLVPRVKAAGIRVHTVGFGEPGALDEDLLRQIAAATGGEYYYAQTPTALQQAFLTSQARTVGDVRHSVLGAARQGEVADAGTFPVPPGVGTLEATLAWPGSDLDVQLRDPDGMLVDDDYDGATIHRTNPEVVVIDNPKGGDWQFGVLGVDVPGPTEEFAAIASTRGTATPDEEPEEEAAPAPRRARDDSGGMSGVTVALLIVVGLLAVVTAGAVGGLVVSRRRARTRCGTCGATVEAGRQECPRCRGPVVAALRFRAIEGPQAGRTFDVRPGHRIGRAEDVEQGIDDPTVSRHHAQVVWTDGGWAVVDLGSSAGTLRNGAAVERARLSPGDVLTLGATVLVVEGVPAGVGQGGRRG